MTSEATAHSWPANGPLADSARCPCLSGETYGSCCGPLHRGTSAAITAERLMRSRFSAYAVGDVGYVRETWHPDTRPAELELDDGIRWYRLDIIAVDGGGMLDTRGTVEFCAYFRGAVGSAERGEQHEVSSFVRERGQWLYRDALRTVDPGESSRRTER